MFELLIFIILHSKKKQLEAKLAKICLIITVWREKKFRVLDRVLILSSLKKIECSLECLLIAVVKCLTSLICLRNMFFEIFKLHLINIEAFLVLWVLWSVDIHMDTPLPSIFWKNKGGVSVAASFFLRISLVSKNFGASRRFKRGGIHRDINW